MGLICCHFTLKSLYGPVKWRIDFTITVRLVTTLGYSNNRITVMKTGFAKGLNLKEKKNEHIFGSNSIKYFHSFVCFHLLFFLNYTDFLFEMRDEMTLDDQPTENAYINIFIASIWTNEMNNQMFDVCLSCYFVRCLFFLSFLTDGACNRALYVCFVCWMYLSMRIENWYLKKKTEKYLDACAWEKGGTIRMNININLVGREAC